MDPTFTGGVTLAVPNMPGLLGGTLTVTPSAGIAIFSGLTIDTANAAGYALQVTAGSLSTTTGQVIVSPGAITQLVITAQPAASVTAGTPFGMTVTAKDIFGNTVTSFNNSVSIAVAADPGGGVLDGQPSVVAVAGVATFSGLTIDKAAAGYTFQVSYDSLNTTSVPVEVDPGLATQLLITTQPPTNVAAGKPFGLSVSAEDPYDNVATGFGGNIALALATNPGGDTLGGTLTPTLNNGVATFAGLTLTQLDHGYTIQATSGALALAVTTPFNVIVAATTLVLTTAPPSSVTAGQVFGLTITVEDGAGNAETGFSGNVSLALASNPANATLNGTTTVSVINGEADFNGLMFDTAGVGYIIQATSSGLTAIDSGSIQVLRGHIAIGGDYTAAVHHHRRHRVRPAHRGRGRLRQRGPQLHRYGDHRAAERSRRGHSGRYVDRNGGQRRGDFLRFGAEQGRGLHAPGDYHRIDCGDYQLLHGDGRAGRATGNHFSALELDYRGSRVRSDRPRRGLLR